MSRFEISPILGLVNVPISFDLLSGECSPSLIKNNYYIKVDVWLTNAIPESDALIDSIDDDNINESIDSGKNKDKKTSNQVEHKTNIELDNKNNIELCDGVLEEPPCSIKTTLLFNSEAILNYRCVDFKLFSLYLLGHEETDLEFGEYPKFKIARSSSELNFIAKGAWASPEKFIDYDIPSERNKRKNLFYSPEHDVCSLNLRSQIYAKSFKKTVSLYPLALDRAQTIDGQEVWFSSDLFISLYLLVFRTHKRENENWVRYMSLIALPITHEQA